MWYFVGHATREPCTNNGTTMTFNAFESSIVAIAEWVRLCATHMEFIELQIFSQ